MRGIRAVHMPWSMGWGPTVVSLTEGSLDLDGVGLLRVLTGPHRVHGFHSEDVLLARGQAVHHEPGETRRAWLPGVAFPSFSRNRPANGP